MLRTLSPSLGPVAGPEAGPGRVSWTGLGEPRASEKVVHKQTLLVRAESARIPIA